MKTVDHGYRARSSERSRVAAPAYRFRFLAGLEDVATLERVRANVPFLGPF